MHSSRQRRLLFTTLAALLSSLACSEAPTALDLSGAGDLDDAGGSLSFIDGGFTDQRTADASGAEARIADLPTTIREVGPSDILRRDVPLDASVDTRGDLGSPQDFGVACRTLAFLASQTRPAP